MKRFVNIYVSFKLLVLIETSSLENELHKGKKIRVKQKGEMDEVKQQSTDKEAVWVMALKIYLHLSFHFLKSVLFPIQMCFLKVRQAQV